MTAEPGDLVCFSHLRWGFVFQRPNHLMTRFARRQRVFFIEEPVFEDGVVEPRLDQSSTAEGVVVCVPRLSTGTDQDAAVRAQRALVDALVEREKLRLDVAWFYTPMALRFARHLTAPVVVYDCMDELGAFLGAPPELRELENELFERATLVFTGGHSLYEAKRRRHPRIQAFPSSVDAEHFSEARHPLIDPPDQASIAHPRVGFFGVIDERLDVELLDALARERPDLQIVMLGPVVKIDEKTLPRHPNLHWLGHKSYQDLPAYIGGWDVAIMPFALNDATRFISPTKTLEYLAAGRPVVSTAIRDVVEPYERLGLVRIADRESFAREIEALLHVDRAELRLAADAYLAETSWDRTFAAMYALVQSQLPAARPAALTEEKCSTI